MLLVLDFHNSLLALQCPSLISDPAQYCFRMAASAPTPVAVEPNLEASGVRSFSPCSGTCFTDNCQYGGEKDSGYDSDMYVDHITGNGSRCRQALANTVKPRASYTTSLSSDITAYKHENGRRYHAYKEGSRYWGKET